MAGSAAALAIRVLPRHGKSIRKSIRAIARAMGLSRNTVRRSLRDDLRDAAASRDKPRPPRSTRLDPVKDDRTERMRAAAPAWIGS